MFRPLFLALAAVILLPVVHAPGAGAWSTGPYLPDELVALPDGVFRQDLQVVTDGAGGFYAVWAEGATEFQGDTALVHRFDGNGQPVWPEALELRSATLDINNLTAITDGQGGLYVALDDWTGFDRTVFAYYIDGSFDIQWGEDVAPGRNSSAVNPVLADMGPAGVFVAWEQRATDSLFAQRIENDGSRMWGTTGIDVCSTLEQFSGEFAAGGTGGLVYLVWPDTRNQGAGDGTDLFGQLFDSSFSRWGNGGIAIDQGSGDALDPDIATDAEGNVLVTYLDDGQVAFQLLVPDGGFVFRRTPWTTPATGNSIDPRLIPHPTFGFYLAWSHYTGGLVPDVFVQRVTAFSGGRLWGQEAFSLTDGNFGGLFDLTVGPQGDLALLYERNDLNRLTVQVLSEDGQPRFPGAGLVVDGRGSSFISGIVPAGDDFLAAWIDRHREIELDVRGPLCGARIDRWGYLGDPAPVVTAVSDYPADQGGVARLDWRRSYLDDPGKGDVTRYTVWRRYAGGAKAAPAPAGRAAALAAGLDPWLVDKQATAGWAYVDEAPAYFQDLYAYHAPTYGDSSDVGVIVTDFKVIAHTAQPTPYWESNVLAGSSIDNLAPGAPLNLSAAPSAATVELQWSPAPDTPDLREYRLYGGAIPDFATGPGSLLAATADTAAVAALPTTGPAYYVVTAVDVHGNEGPASNVAEISALASTETPPAAPRLVGAAPNPFNPATSVRFELPVAQRVHLMVLDVRGRLVRTLTDGEWPAGSHAVRWDGRDQDGRPVTSGAYFVRMETAAEQFTQKVLLVK